MEVVEEVEVFVIRGERIGARASGEWSGMTVVGDMVVTTRENVFWDGIKSL